MQFISAEEFLKQPVEVQKVFLDWWKPSIGDLFNYPDIDEHDCVEVQCIQSKNKLRTIALAKVVPVFTEEQLRKFIEDKTESKIIVQPSMEGKYHVGYDKYCAWSESGDYSGVVYCDDLLQAYWKAAIQIAEKEVQDKYRR